MGENGESFYVMVRVVGFSGLSPQRYSRQIYPNLVFMVKRPKAYKSRTVLSEFEVFEEAWRLPYKENCRSGQISSRPLSAGVSPQIALIQV